MAVKQNNSEESETVSGSANTTAGTGKTKGGHSGVSGAISKSNNNANTDGAGAVCSSDPPVGGVGGGNNTAGKKAAQNYPARNAPLSNASNGINMPQKTNSIKTILNLIQYIQESRGAEIPDIFKIYHYLLAELAHVEIPRQPESLKAFKEDIIKVGKFFREANDKFVYLFYLREICQFITKAEGNDVPSCAVAIIFQLFSTDMVVDAVQSLLVNHIPDQSIRRTVRALSEWLRMCNFCPNLNIWIITILGSLQEQQKYALLEDIASDNINALFCSLIMPVLRPKVAPIVFLLLTAVPTPAAFHKVLPRIPKVSSCLQQQGSGCEEFAAETKAFMQQFADLTNALMVRYPEYAELYDPVIEALKDYKPSSNYLDCIHGIKDFDNTDDENSSLQITNAKVGLVNLGNTCYMNSVLQALAMTKEFSREILLSECTSPLLNKMREQIALMLFSIRYELVPTRVLNATRPLGFAPGLQQDSSEFLGYLLETLHEHEMAFHRRHNQAAIESSDIEENEENAKTNEDEMDLESHGAAALCEQSMEIAGEIYQLPLQLDLLEDNSSDTKEDHENAVIPLSNKVFVTSTIERTFTGKVATTYRCLQCGHQSRNIDSFRDLQLSFPEAKNECASNYSVQDLIEYYCSPEKLDGDNQYNCEKCKMLTDAERFINITSAPKNLILTLKHFKYDQKYHMRAKLMHKVFHDEKVSVKVCSPQTLDEVSQVHYDLYAGVVHSGFSMDSGHYYTYASDSAKHWYKFNDNIVTHSESEELHNLTPPNTPYILFYQMGSRSNDTNEAPATSTIVKVDAPTTPTLDELPRNLREFVVHDNKTFEDEVKERRLRHMRSAGVRANKPITRNGGNGGSRDDDDAQPPGGGGGSCGDKTFDMNTNRYVY